MIEIPFFDASSFEQLLTLDKAVYRVQLTWNGRENAWTMILFQQDGTPIISGLRVTPEWEILYRYHVANAPPGAIIAVDLTGNGAYPTRDSLGTDLKLVYVTEDEIANGLV